MNVHGRGAVAPGGDPGRSSAEAQRRPRACPRCAGPMQRIRRRLIDRLLSFFVPMKRYRCAASGCGWCGNLRRRRVPMWR